MLEFRPLKLEDKEQYDKIVKPLESHLCPHCFTDLFMWKHVYVTYICFDEGFVFIKQWYKKHPNYMAPLGTGDLGKAVQHIKDNAKMRNAPFTLFAINKEQKQQLAELDDKLVFEEQRDNEDYIYTSESLINLAGKKLHSKRNFVNRFKTAYEGRWQYENMTKDNMREMFKFHIDWCEINGDLENDEIKGETESIALLMKNADYLGAKGGLLRLDGKIIAITIGSQATDDMFVVHIEKADYTIPGAYQMINNQFAINNLADIKYVNREEDMGKEGLRKAKLSYYPEFLAENYIAYYKES